MRELKGHSFRSVPSVPSLELAGQFLHPELTPAYSQKAAQLSLLPGSRLGPVFGDSFPTTLDSSLSGLPDSLPNRFLFLEGKEGLPFSPPQNAVPRPCWANKEEAEDFCWKRWSRGPYTQIGTGKTQCSLPETSCRPHLGPSDTI